MKNVLSLFAEATMHAQKLALTHSHKVILWLHNIKMLQFGDADVEEILDLNSRKPREFCMHKTKHIMHAAQIQYSFIQCFDFCCELNFNLSWDRERENCRFSFSHSIEWIILSLSYFNFKH